MLKKKRFAEFIQPLSVRCELVHFFLTTLSPNLSYNARLSVCMLLSVYLLVLRLFV
jgi:hypothetical protein